MKPKTESRISIQPTPFTNEEAIKYKAGVSRVHDAIKSIERKRKIRLDDIIYAREIEAIDALHK